MKKVLSLVLAALLILSSFSFAFAQDAETVKITVIHTNDTHSRLAGTSSEIGFAKIAALVKEAKAANPNTLVLDAGDTLHGMPIVNISKGENAIKVLDAVGYDYMTLGNHDFNHGLERLLELKDMAAIGMLSANIEDKNGEYVFTPYVIEEIGGVKVGIFGLSTPDTSYLANPKYVENLTFKDPIEVSREMVAELEGKADVVIALAHLGLDESSSVTSKALAEAVEGIDLIVDGHSHTKLEAGQLVKDTLIAQTEYYGKNLGYVDIEVQNGEVVNMAAKLLSVADTGETVPDPDLSAFIDSIDPKKDPAFNEVIAKTDVYLDGVRENVRTKETNFGNLSADAARAATGADIAFVNGGGIREDVPAGEVTKGKIAAVFPFGNTIEVKKITGTDLKAMLEWSVSDYPAAKGAFLQVSGLEFTFDPAKPVNSKVVEIKVGGEVFDEAKEYTVAINDFMSDGGDGYSMLANYDVLAISGTYEEIIQNYLATNGTAGSDVSGRIKVKETVAEEVTYIVVPGDVLWKIAAKYGYTYQELAEYNNIANPHLIFPDQVIKVPQK